MNITKTTSAHVPQITPNWGQHRSSLDYISDFLADRSSMGHGAAEPRGCGRGSPAGDAPGRAPAPSGCPQSHPRDTVTLGGPGCWWELVTRRGRGERSRKGTRESQYLPYRSADSSESAADACTHKAFPKIASGSPLSPKKSRGALILPGPPLRAAGLPWVRIPSAPSAPGFPKAPPLPEPFPCPLRSARGEEQLGRCPHNTLHKFSPSLLQT